MTMGPPSITAGAEPAISPGPRLMLKSCQLRLEGPGGELEVHVD